MAQKPIVRLAEMEFGRDKLSITAHFKYDKLDTATYPEPCSHPCRGKGVDTFDAGFGSVEMGSSDCSHVWRGRFGCGSADIV